MISRSHPREHLSKAVEKKAEGQADPSPVEEEKRESNGERKRVGSGNRVELVSRQKMASRPSSLSPRAEVKVEPEEADWSPPSQDRRICRRDGDADADDTTSDASKSPSLSARGAPKSPSLSARGADSTQDVGVEESLVADSAKSPTLSASGAGSNQAVGADRADADPPVAKKPKASKLRDDLRAKAVQAQELLRIVQKQVSELSALRASAEEGVAEDNEDDAEEEPEEGDGDDDDPGGGSGPGSGPGASGRVRVKREAQAPSEAQEPHSSAAAVDETAAPDADEDASYSYTYTYDDDGDQAQEELAAGTPAEEHAEDAAAEALLTLPEADAPQLDDLDKDVWPPMQPLGASLSHMKW